MVKWLKIDICGDGLKESRKTAAGEKLHEGFFFLFFSSPWNKFFIKKGSINQLQVVKCQRALEVYRQWRWLRWPGSRWVASTLSTYRGGWGGRIAKGLIEPSLSHTPWLINYHFLLDGSPRGHGALLMMHCQQSSLITIPAYVTVQNIKHTHIHTHKVGLAPTESWLWKCKCYID